MAKKAETNDGALSNPVFAFGLDGNAKPRGARFTQGLNDQLVNAALEMNCRVVQNHSAAFAAIGMRLPVGRVYASGKAFIPNIRRELYDKLEFSRQQPPERIEGVTPVNLFKEQAPAGEPSDKAPNVPCISPMISGLPKSWDAIGPGHMVLIHESPEDGWWEAVVQSRDLDVLTLRFRDFPKAKPFQRHVTAVALVNPGPV